MGTRGGRQLAPRRPTILSLSAPSPPPGMVGDGEKTGPSAGGGGSRHVGVMGRLLITAAAVYRVGYPTGEDSDVPTLHLLEREGGWDGGKGGKQGREAREVEKECS